MTKKTCWKGFMVTTHYITEKEFEKFKNGLIKLSGRKEIKIKQSNLIFLIVFLSHIYSLKSSVFLFCRLFPPGWAWEDYGFCVPIVSRHCCVYKL